MKLFKPKDFVVLLCVAAALVLITVLVVRERARLEQDYLSYFGMPIPENDAARRATLPGVAYTLNDLRGKVPDLERRSLERELEKALWHYDGSKKSEERYAMLVVRMDIFMLLYRPAYDHFTRACEVAQTVYAKSSFLHGPVTEADAMFRNADCPQYRVRE